MADVTDQILRQAKQEFLGREPVVGIGLVEDHGLKIAFLLERVSFEIENAIRRWAAQRDVGCEISVTGANVPLAAGRRR
jgi:hypothetical protein